MNTTRSISLASTLIACAGILLSCSSPLAPTGSGGTATLSILIAGNGARTIAPTTANLAVASYSITMSRTGYADITRTFTAAPYTLSGLETGGPWNGVVTASNGSGTVGTATFSIATVTTAGPNTATVSFDYVPAAAGATGGMSITLVFPHSVGIDGLAATLDGVSVAPTFTQGSPNDRVVYSASGVASSAPVLRINLIKDGVVFYPWAESVWVYKNITTTTSETLTAADFGQAPAAPDLAPAQVQADGSVLIGWSNVTDAAGFTVERSADSGSTWAAVGSTDVTPIVAGSLIYLDTPPTATVTYSYRVTASNIFGAATSTTTSVDFVKATGVAMYPAASATITVGATYQLSASLSPINATVQMVVWTSSAGNVATVSGDGLVTAVGAGTATITATTVDGDFTATCVVTVE